MPEIGRTHALRGIQIVRLRLKSDGTRAETRFRVSAKRTSPFKSTGASVQSTTGSRGVRISGSNAGYTKFRGRVKGTGYPLHLPVSPSLPLPCVTVYHHISTGLYVILYSETPGRGARWDRNCPECNCAHAHPHHTQSAPTRGVTIIHCGKY